MKHILDKAILQSKIWFDSNKLTCLLSCFHLKPVPTALAQVDREKIYQWINELSSPETRENALLELSKKRESVPDLAPMLWHSFGTIAALLQVGVYIHELQFSPVHHTIISLPLPK